MSSRIDWNGPARQPCPICDRGQRDRALSVTINPDGSGVAHCFRCQYVQTTGDSIRPGRTERGSQRAQRHEVLSDYGRDLWGACKPLAGPALAYLAARGCVIPPADGDVRYHHGLRHPLTGHVGPALVALLTDAADNTQRTLHRTWINDDGTKPSAADPPRLLLGSHRKAGAVCRLWPDEAVTVGLGVAEGIESALALAHGFTPVWACIDAGNLAELPVLSGIESLTIAADNDRAGIDAGNRCARRWHADGREVFLVVPPEPGTDMADVAVRAEA